MRREPIHPPRRPLMSASDQLLTDLSAVVNEAAVVAAVEKFAGAGGSVDPPLVARAIRKCFLSSHRTVLLQALASRFALWDCNFARDIVLAIDYDYERGGVAKEIVPFVRDLDKFESIVLGQGCPQLSQYAQTEILDKVKAEQEKRRGGTIDSSAHTSPTPTHTASGGSKVGGVDTGDGSFIFAQPSVIRVSSDFGSSVSHAAAPAPLPLARVVGVRRTPGPTTDTPPTIVEGRYCVKNDENHKVTPVESNFESPHKEVAPHKPLSEMNETIDLQQETITFFLATDEWPKEEAKRTWGSPILSPLQKRGIGPQEWAIIVSELQEVYEANPFVSACGKDVANCAECCYFCIPGGPIQTLLCMFNPITWCIYGSQERKKEKAKETAKSILERRSVNFKIGSGPGGRLCAFFECHEGKFKQPKQQNQTILEQPQQHVIVR